MDEDRLELIAERQHKYGYSNKAEYNYDSEDSSENEEEDEHGELITPALDGQIMKTIGLIRAQDPSIYEATNHFFIPSEIETARQQWKEKQIQEKKNKPMNLKEYHQKVLLEDNGLVNEDAELKKVKDISEMTHVEQQEYLKKEMKVGIYQASMLNSESVSKEDINLTLNARLRSYIARTHSWETAMMTAMTKRTLSLHKRRRPRKKRMLRKTITRGS